MNTTHRHRAFLALGLALLLPVLADAQDLCEPWYTVPQFERMGTATGMAGNSTHNLALTVGQPIVQLRATDNRRYSVGGGFWGYYLKEPRPPLTAASDGDFKDRIVVTWDIENDSTAAPVTGDKVTLYRNGYVLTTLPINQRQYQDFNVFPGETYEYAVTTSNRFGESHQWLDQGFLNPNGTVIGTVKTPNGNPVIDVKVVLTPNLGRSAFFSDQAYVYFPSQVRGLKNSGYTIEGWFRASPVEGQPAAQTLFAAVDSATANAYVIVELTQEGKLRWQHAAQAGQPGQALVSPVEYVQAREWRHFACAFDRSSGGLTLYVDGDVVAAGSGGAAIDDEWQVVLGKRGPKQHERYFNGRLDDLRLWTTARTRAEIRQDMDRTLSGIEEYLHAYWKFDEPQGEKVFDLTANDNDGAICRVERSDLLAPVYLSGLTDEKGNYSIKGIYYGAGTEFTVTPQKETPIGRALRFDGVDDFVAFPNDRVDLREGYTLEGWFKTAGAGEHALFSAVHPNTGLTHLRVELANGKLKCVHRGAEVVSEATYNHEYWHHFAVSYDKAGARTTFYVDGQPVGTIETAAAIEELSALVIGRQLPEGGARFYVGLIDELRLWNYGRTAEQVGGTMNQTLQGNEAGLAAYWRLNEGDGDLVNDDTGNGHAGEMQGGVAWVDDIALREVFVHTFEAESRQVVLNPSHTSVDRVEFTDISQIGVSGFVRYQGTPCFIEGAEILVDGQQLAPPLYTDENGKFVAEFEPGASGKILSVRYLNHPFAPPFIELPRITRPLTGIYFDDTAKRSASGRVVGGVCQFPITPSQGQIEVHFTAIDGCVQVTAVPDANTGIFSVQDLPPLIYQVTVDHPDPEIDAFFTADTLSLQGANGEIDFVYRAAPQVAVRGFPELGCGLRAMAMGARHTLTIDVFEEYMNHTVQGPVVNRCAAESGDLVIVDGIGDKGQVEATFENGTAHYEVAAGYPNIVGGGNHPHQKSIQVTATDALGQNATVEEWVYVTGHRPRQTAFATTTPEIPLMILREPPGDGSYAYLSQGSTLSQSVGFAFNRGTEMGGYMTAHLGPDFSMSTGFIVEIELDIDVTLDFTNEFGISINNSSATEQTWTMTTNETFQTAGNGDVYVGGALNILYGVTDILEIDPQTCQPQVRQEVILVPDGFATTYIYSEKQILGQVIPNLETIGDQASAARWRGFVANNRRLKELATLDRNLSFDAGAVYQYEETTEVSQSQTVEFEIEMNQAFAMDMGIQVNGMGVTGGVRVGTQMTVGSSQITATTQTNTVGFVLADDDPGDSYTVDVKRDLVYGTPVFQTVSGFSSCPWQANTVPFDGPQLAVSPPRQVDVPPDQVAVFALNLGNVSQADADREYHLRVINETNPDGAMVAINGVNLEDHMSFFVPAGQSVQTTMTVARGPTAYEYDGIKLQLVSPCEYERWQEVGTLQLADTIAVDVHFKVPCSECSVAVPEDNWLVTAAHGGNTLNVTLNGYDRADPNLEKIELQYRRGGGDWFVAGSVPKANLVDDFLIFPWNIDPSVVIDGDYQLRGRVVCGQGLVPGISAVVDGRIDREPPQILGAPSPEDGILNPDDAISLRFNEEVECGQISAGAGHIALTNTVTSEAVDFTHTCGGDEIVIAPNLQNKFIENQTLRARVGPVADRRGNLQGTPIEWELYVNRNPIEWSGEDIDNVVIYVDETFSTTRLLRNTGGSQRSYELVGAPDWLEAPQTERVIPSWLEVSPEEGTIGPGAAQTVTFRVSGPEVGYGSYAKTIYASGTMGDEPRQVDVRVLCHPPEWEVNPMDFQHSMTISALLYTEGELSADVYDVVGAFVGDELRGVAQVQYIARFADLAGVHPYEVFLTVYSNQTGGEELSFRVWDASECQELGMVLEDYAFQANARLGTPTSPVTLTATQQIIANISFLPGWNWFSLNLVGDDMSVDAALRSLEPENNDLIKNQQCYAQYVALAGQWLGSLTQQNLQNRCMYMIRLAGPDTLEMIGYAVDVEATTIPVQSGWNWIGYLPQQGMSVDQSLASLPAVTGDLVKSQFEFAQFVEGRGWIGSLRFMNPRLGYQLFSQFQGALSYPFYEAPAARPVVAAEPIALAGNAAGWSVRPRDYRHSMTLIGTVEGDGVELAAEDVLGAFVDGECRGVAQPISAPGLERALVFLMVYGDAPAGGEVVRFALHDADEGRERFIPTEVEFQADEMLGTVLEPFRLETRERRLGDPGFVPEVFMLGQSYPNPFNPSTQIGYGLPREARVEIAVYNLLGQRIRTLVAGFEIAGYRYATWDGRNSDGYPVPSGIYFITMKAGDFQAVEKVLLLK